MTDFFGTSPALLLLVAACGATLSLAVRHALSTRATETERHHAWAALMATLATVALTARMVQRSAVDLERARLGVHLQYSVAGLVLAGYLLIAPGLSRRTRLLSLLVLGLVDLDVLTGAFVGAEPLLRTDYFGHQYYAFKVGPLAYALLPAAFAAAIHGIRVLREVRGKAPWQPKTIVAIISVCLAAAVHDALLNRGLIHSIHLMEYAFTGMAFMTSAAISLHAKRMYAGLETTVESQTRQLEESRAHVETLMVSLDEARRTVPRIADSALDGVLVHERGKVIDMNEPACQILGVDPSDLVGSDVRDWITEAERADAEPIVRGDVRDAREVTVRRRDGTTLPVEIIGRAMNEGDATIGVLSLRDITARKRAQEKQAISDRMVSLATLAAGAAHEINNPLAYATVNITVALDQLTDIPADVREALEDAQEGCQRIARIVRDLASLSREQPHELRSVDVVDVIDRAIQMTQHEVRHRARFIRDYAPVPRVTADPARLGQLFVNLIVNAAQAIPEGNVDDNTVTIRTRAAGARVVIEVSDTGSGIPNDVLPQIFAPFFTTKQRDGTGLGLSVCHGIVSELDGEIGVTSEEGVGTTFSILLPAAERPRMTSYGDGLPERGAAERAARILVVDDEPSILAAVVRMLRGHEVSTALSGREALAILGESEFDLVLCDLMMPTMSGMDLHAEVARRSPELAARLVFMTGGAFTPRAAAFMREVPNECIRKPFDQRKLIGLVTDRAAPAAAPPA